MKNPERAAEIAGLTTAAKALLAGQAPTREKLAAILARLEALAAKRHLWGDRDYPVPAGATAGLYLIGEAADRGFAVYLNVMGPGTRVAPHNHTTWACVAAVEGCEYNYLYDRVDNGAVPGRAQLREAGTVPVAPGRGIALMPEDIHAIEGRDPGIMRHLHFYGRALEVLDARLVFDPAAGTCKPMPIAQSIRG